MKILIDLNELVLLKESKNLFLEEWEEERLLRKEIFSEDSKSNDDKEKDKEKKEGKEKDKKVSSKIDKIGKKLLLKIKDLHTTNPEYLKKGLPQFSKLLTRGIIIAGVFSIAGPICGLITFFSSKFLSDKFDAEEREKLIGMYDQKLAYVNSKIENIKGDDTKIDKYNNLLKIKTSLSSNIKKLKVVKDD